MLIIVGVVGAMVLANVDYIIIIILQNVVDPVTEHLDNSIQQTFLTVDILTCQIQM